MTTYQRFLHQHSRSPDAVVAAVADNCRFDERAGTERWQRFESLLPGPPGSPGSVGWEDWAETNQLHMERYCTVSRPGVPDAFLEINRSAWLDQISDNQSLVRIETLSRPLSGSALDLDRLTELLQQARSDDADGATVPLVPEAAGTITAEVIHCRIDYKQEHLWKVGWITRPHQLAGSQLCDARDLHLLALREAYNRRDFGELLEGRI